MPTAEVVICGAGIAGISAAYHLAVRHGVRDIVLVEQGAPLSLTSDKSTECYRNWWPGPGDAMVSLMNRSIDLMEDLARESGNTFQLNRRGYLYVTADPARIPVMQQTAAESSALGAGPVRIHDGRVGGPEYCPAPAHGFEGQPYGADLILDPALIRAHFPYLSRHAVAALHTRRCGWFSAQQMGIYLLERARAAGVRLIAGQVTGVDVRGGRVQAVRVDGEAGSDVIATPRFVDAAGPLANHVAALLGVELPIFHELHVKVAFKDTLRSVPRHAPLLVWADPQVLPWSGEERELLAESEETRPLLGELPSGVHTRPEGGLDSPWVLLLWAYHTPPVPTTLPPAYDPFYPEVALRGLVAMLPAARGYLDTMPQPIVDGGYYTKTRENRPLIGPLPVDGAYLIGALSGFGLMAGCAAGELLAVHVAGGPLPLYAPAFAPDRYTDPAYCSLLERWEGTGQL